MTPLLAIALVSTTVAVIMSIVAWRALREEWRRSDARVAALAAEIHDVHLDVGDLGLRSQPSSVGPDLFALTRRSFGRSRWDVALVAGVLAIGVAAAIAVAFSGESRTASASAASPSSRAGASQQSDMRRAPEAAPLVELVALGQERDADRLIVRGLIVNPSGGSEVDRLIAVVFGFNREGEFVASGRSAVASAILPPGAKSSFVVTVPGATDVVRYRVSFRTDERVVPHADRRAKN